MRAPPPPPDDPPGSGGGAAPAAALPRTLCDLPGSDLWLREEEDGVFRVGLTPEGAGRAGSIAVYRGPRVGARVERGRPVASLETSKWVGHLSAPADGTVVATNAEAERVPASIVADALGGGWLFRFQADDPAELRTRLSVRAPA